MEKYIHNQTLKKIIKIVLRNKNMLELIKILDSSICIFYITDDSKIMMISNFETKNSLMITIQHMITQSKFQTFLPLRNGF